jgi:hypothetical protein
MFRVRVPRLLALPSVSIFATCREYRPWFKIHGDIKELQHRRYKVSRMLAPRPGALVVFLGLSLDRVSFMGV